MVANDAIGNFVVVTPLMKMLRDAYQPGELHYYGGSRTWELQVASELIDATYPLWGSPPWEAAAEIGRRRSEEPYALVVNVESGAPSKFYASLAAGATGYVCGPCVGCDGRSDLAFHPDDRGRLWQDPDWTAEDLPLRYDFLATGFIAELFCRLCYLEGPIPGYQIPIVDPHRPVPDLLLAPSASLPEKLWADDGWLAVPAWARSVGLTVGLLGGSPVAQKRFWKGCSVEDELVARGDIIDMRGTLSLPEVAGVLARAKMVLTIDNGILHLAAAVGTPTVGLFRPGFHRLWAPPASKLRVLIPGVGRAVSEIPQNEVMEALESAK